MTLDLPKLYKAYNPTNPLAIGNAEDKKYYIDFSSVRGGEIIEELEQTISLLSPDDPTCQLFTGHIGCGKSTELLRLKALLEQNQFYVVYFESNKSLNLYDVDVTDIMLAITCQIDACLKSDGINLQPTYFSDLLNRLKKFLGQSISIKEVGLPGIGQLGWEAKNSPDLRQQLRQYLEPYTRNILEAINKEIIAEANKKLKQKQKKGLVVIVDNLDLVGGRTVLSGKSQLEYLFIERGAEMCQLNCHIVYIVPLALMLSNEAARLKERFGSNPFVLPMVPVKMRDGEECTEGMKLLRQMVLARAFPEQSNDIRLSLITELFDSPETLDRLCCVSGGHVRGLVELIRSCLTKQRQLPLLKESVEKVIKESCNQLVKPLTNEQRDIIREVALYKKVTGEEKYRNLVRNLLIFEYRDEDGSWFDINPILAERQEFKL